MADTVVGVLAVVGATFVLLAGIGVLRFPDIYARMHAAGKATTMGTALIAVAGAISIDGGAAKILLAGAVIFITAPSASHVIGRAAYSAEGIDIRLDGPDDLDDLMSQDPMSDPDEG